MAGNGLYEKLKSTATGFVLATSPKILGSNEPDSDRFRSYLAPNFRMSWGHKFFVSGKVGLQGFADSEQFLSHQGGMAKHLKTWSVTARNTCVDVNTYSAVLRADFYMTVPGNEPLLNETVFWIIMDEAGEKVVNACEFVDAAASAELSRRI